MKRRETMRLEGLKVACLVEQDFEDLELWYPVLRLREEGAEITIAGKTAKTTYTGKYGVPVESDCAFSDIHPDDYHGLLIPGGWAPDKLRRYHEVIQLVKDMDCAKKPIGQICHAGWVLISAGILKGKRVTSTPGIRDDMVNAGAVWVDEPVVVDGHLVSSRRPIDLPIYTKTFADLVAEFS
jgi:protease I